MWNKIVLIGAVALAGACGKSDKASGGGAAVLMKAAQTYKDAACACKDLACAQAARQVLQDAQFENRAVEKKSTDDERVRRGQLIAAGDACTDAMRTP